MQSINQTGKNLKKKLLLIFVFIVSLLAAQAQVPEKYIFFKGDTLEGLDLNALCQKMHIMDSLEPMSDDSKSSFMYTCELFYMQDRQRLLDHVVPTSQLKLPQSNSLQLGTPTSQCNNIDFEDANLTNWSDSIGYNGNSLLPLSTFQSGMIGAINSSMLNTCASHTIMSSAGGTDPYGGFPVLDPWGGSYSERIGGSLFNLATSTEATEFPSGKACVTKTPAAASTHTMGETLETTFTVSKQTALFTYSYAVVLNFYSTHGKTAEPYFKVQVFDAKGDTIPCMQYYQEINSTDSSNSKAAPIVPAGYIKYTGGTLYNYNADAVYYLPWKLNSINLSAYIGQTITIKVSVAGCAQQSHFAYAYVDANCLSAADVIAVKPPTCTTTTAVFSAPPGAPSYKWTQYKSTSTAGIQSVTASGDSATINLSGHYQVVVGGCNPYTIDTVITLPTPMAASLANASVSCAGLSTGALNVTGVSGGFSAPYSYNWSGSSAITTGQGTAAVSDLAAGTYTVTVSDANGCTITTSASITQPAALSVTTSAPAVACGALGAVTASASGGTGTLKYQWTGGGSITDLLTGVNAGTYVVTVTDANGCTATSSATITDHAGVTALSIPAASTCVGKSSASVTVQPTGGTPNYTYSWSNNASTTATATGLSAGLYTVTVTDANGCTLTNSGSVNAVGPTSTTPSQVNILCYNVSSGTATINVTGGTALYTYSWSNSATGPITNMSATATNAILGLAAGTYSVTVSDANGCTITNAITITQPASAVAAVVTTTNTLCGAQTGTANVTVAGGTPGPGYTYSWVGGNQTASASNLAAGNYTVTVTDNNGCTTTASGAVSNTSGVTALAIPAASTCIGTSNATVTVVPTGGTANYTYSWSNSASTIATATGLSAGSYTVTVTDANKCSLTNMGTISAVGPTGSTPSQVNVSCFNVPTGAASVSVTGGTPNYTYSWSNSATGPIANTATAANNQITGLAAGVYSVTVSDNDGCTVTNSITITQPTALTASTSPTNTLCNGSSDGQATVTPLGGTPPYSASWTNTGTGLNQGTGLTITGLSLATYSVIVTDNNGCTIGSNAIVGSPTPISLIDTTTLQTTCNQANGAASESPSGGTPIGGKAIPAGYTYFWSNGTDNYTAASLTNIAAGTYTVTVTDNNGCNATIAVHVLPSTGVTATLQGTVAATCSDSCNAMATAQYVGGIAPYTYNWNNGETTITANKLCPNTTYTITVTDSKGCSSTTTATPTAPSALTLPAIATQTICIGSSATILAAPAGGTPTYSATWSLPGNPVTTQTGLSVNVNPVTTTTYTLSVVDANNCPTTTQTVQIVVNPPLIDTALAPAPVCAGTQVILKATGSGGDNKLTYTWLTTPSQIGQTLKITANATQTYSVEVTDACGTPPYTTTVQVAVVPPPTIKFQAAQLTSCPNLCTTFTDLSTPAPGDTIKQWMWTFNNDTTSTIQNPYTCFKTGIYTVKLKVTAKSGCTTTDSIHNYIDVYPASNAAFTVNPTSATIDNPYFNFYNESSGGTINYLHWMFGDSANGTSSEKNPQYAFTAEGTYCIRLAVSNTDGCVDTTTRCVIVGPDFTFYIPNAFTPNGDTRNDTFSGQGTGIKNYTMYIYNRWGELLYTTNDLNKGWDGTNHGGPVCDQDVYNYLVKITDVFNKEHSYIGEVTLIK